MPDILPLKLAALKTLSRLRLLGPVRRTKEALLSLVGRSYIDQHRLQNLYRNLVMPGDLVFDIGANRGDVTEAFLSLGCRVVAVEANPALIPALRRRFQSRPDAVIVDKALGEAPGHLDFLVCDEMPELSTASEEWSRSGLYAGVCRWNRRVRVETTTLDALVATCGEPAFMKIDVEGYEQAVLSGLSSPPPCLSFEFSHPDQGSLSACLHRLDETATGHGFSMQYRISEGKSLVLDPEGWRSSSELLAHLRSAGNGPRCGDVYARRTSHPEQNAGGDVNCS